MTESEELSHEPLGANRAFVGGEQVRDPLHMRLVPCCDLRRIDAVPDSAGSERHDFLENRSQSQARVRVHAGRHVVYATDHFRVRVKLQHGRRARCG